MRLHPQQLLDAIEGIAYVTDPEGIVMAIGRPTWNAFASDNDGDDLIDGAGVIGRSLFNLISGDEVIESYERIFDALLDRRARRARLISRCDAPSVKRDLLIVISPLVGGNEIEGVLVQSVTFSEEMRPAIDLFDFRAVRERGERRNDLPVLRICSFCQRVRRLAVDGGEREPWTSAEVYYQAGGDAHVRISHGICERCFEDEEAILFT